MKKLPIKKRYILLMAVVLAVVLVNVKERYAPRAKGGSVAAKVVGKNAGH